MSITDRVEAELSRWEFGLSDELPLPIAFEGMSTRPEYWYLYRQAKRRRYRAMYGRYRVPAFSEAAFNTAVDDHYVPLIKLTIGRLPTTRPVGNPPTLRRAQNAGP